MTDIPISSVQRSKSIDELNDAPGTITTSDYHCLIRSTDNVTFPTESLRNQKIRLNVLGKHISLVPVGGTTGQVLRKVSPTDHDLQWSTLLTDDVPEGVSNLYYTESRVSANTSVAAATAHIANANIHVDHTTVSVSGINSISGGGSIDASRTLQLVGDAPTPGSSKYYGTDGAGTKGYFDLPVALAGTLNEVQQDGIQVTLNHSTLDFRATGDASVAVTDQGDGVTRIVIDATGSAGGVSKGTPFVVGELLLASSDVGGGETQSSGITATAVSTHLGLVNAHIDHSGVSITGINSLTGGGDITASRTLELVGDSATPGNSKYYGTDGAGTKGFFDLPAGGGGIQKPNRSIERADAIRGVAPTEAEFPAATIAEDQEAYVYLNDGTGEIWKYQSAVWVLYKTIEPETTGTIEQIIDAGVGTALVHGGNSGPTTEISTILSPDGSITITKDLDGTINLTSPSINTITGVGTGTSLVHSGGTGPTTELSTLRSSNSSVSIVKEIDGTIDLTTTGGGSATVGAFQILESTKTDGNGLLKNAIKLIDFSTAGITSVSWTFDDGINPPITITVNSGTTQNIFLNNIDTYTDYQSSPAVVDLSGLDKTVPWTITHQTDPASTTKAVIAQVPSWVESFPFRFHQGGYDWTDANSTAVLGNEFTGSVSDQINLGLTVTKTLGSGNSRTLFDSIVAAPGRFSVESELGTTSDDAQIIDFTWSRPVENVRIHLADVLLRAAGTDNIAISATETTKIRGAFLVNDQSNAATVTGNGSATLQITPTSGTEGRFDVLIPGPVNKVSISHGAPTTPSGLARSSFFGIIWDESTY